MNILQQIFDFEKKVPEKKALVSISDNTSYTYKEMMNMSRSVAWELRNRGVACGDFVTIELSRVKEFVPAMLGAWMVGAAYVSLDSSYPRERLDFIEKDCKAKTVIDASFFEKLNLENKIEEIHINDAKEPAIMVYTSGSTGNPKGVLHNHASINASVGRCIDYTKSKAEERYALGAPFSFIASVQGVFSPLCVGATAYITPTEVMRDPRLLADFIDENQITRTFMSPKILKLFNPKGNSLKVVTTGSEKVSGIYSDQFKILVMYGQTETASAVMGYELDKAYDNSPIGKCIGNEKVYILDENNQEVAEGEGEICFAGEFATCYYNMPEKSSEVFTENPFKEQDGFDILLHTGDIGKRLPDGNILYVNRKDWMVKINGQRVEPGEIEKVIREVDGVLDAVVKDFVNQYGQIYLCAYYIEKNPIDEASIRNYLSSKLPSYMMPAFFIKLDKFPLNRNGKVDRINLQAPDLSQFKVEYIAPETENEKLVCKGFEEILGLEKVGIDDSFFALGGDSIKTVMLADYCKALGVSAADIFTAKTPREIAILGGAKKINYNEYDANITKAVLTDSQMGIYLECAANPEGLMYNNPMSYCFSKDRVSEDKLLEAIKKTIEAYDTFGLCIKTADGKTYIQRLENALPNIVITDCLDANIEEYKKNFVKPFILNGEQLYRFEIVKTETKIYLLFDMHHIVFDGSSLGVIEKAIEGAYAGLEIDKQEVNLFMLSQHEQSELYKEISADAEAYFERYIGGIEVDSNLPIDKPDNNNDHKCGKITITADADAEAITAYGKALGVTENTVFLGAFAYALAKYTCQTESLFCTASNGRHNKILKNTVGMLVRTLPFYTKIDDEMRVSDYLVSIQDNFFETMKHDAASFGTLARNYGLHSDIMFVYQAEMFNGFTLDGETAALEGIEVEDALANLSVMVIKRNGNYDIALSFNESIYDASMMKRFAKCIGKIASEFVSCKALSKIELVSTEDVKLIDKFNDTDVPIDSNITMDELVAAAAKKYPDHLAVVYLDKKITYKELHEKSDKIAAYIHNKGIGRGDFVSILIPRCEWMPVIALGILKSGAAYQPLDPSYPQDRLNFMVKDANAKLVIADQELIEILTEYDGDTLYINEIDSLPMENVEIEKHVASDPFIILYTSGTTGVPKGCILEHRNIVAFTDWFADKFEITAAAKSAAYASFGFDANMMDTYPILTRGGELHIIAEEIRLNITAIEKYFNENGITNSFMTTQVGRQFAVNANCPGLKYLSVGGEKLVPTNPPENTAFYNLYGPTETTVSVTSFQVVSDSKKLPIGEPNANTKLYVLDKHNRVLPVGAMGELCVAGVQVSRGYLGRPEQTEKVFVKNPFETDEKYARMYRTGDIVRWLDDGNIEFIGRRDGQVKVRGFRIELTEVEKIIREFEGIKDATVAAFDSPAGGKFIAAYIVADEKIDIKALNNFILENKPPYMVPAVTMQIDAIPLNVNSKVDKRKLPAPVFEEEDAEESARPKTKFEQEIMTLVDEAIHCGEISVTANLINYGLTSISAISLLSLIGDKFGCDIPVGTLLNGASIADIEDIIFEYWMSNGFGSKNSCDTMEDNTADYYPLTSVQLGIYYETMKRPNDIMYNIPLCLAFDEIDAEKLKRAAEMVVNAHKYMNTHVEVQGGKLVQVRNNDSIPNVKLVDIAEDELADYQTDFVLPFDLHSGYLYRIEIVKTEKNVYFMMDVHHIIFDGMSTDVFISDLKKAYETGAVSEEAYTYFDYAQDKEQKREGEEYAQAKDYYQQLFSNYESPTEIPVDCAGREEDGVLAYEHAMISKDKVNEFCKKNRITPASLFLAATLYTSSRFSGEKNVYISTISSGRNISKIRRCTGMFVHTIPLAMNFNESMDGNSLLKKSAELMLSGMENEEYSFSEISAQYGYNTSIMYECQLGVISGNMGIDGHDYKMVPLKLDVPKFKIAIVVEDRDGEISVTVKYNNAVYTKEYMKTLASAVKECAERIIENIQTDVASISLLNDEQKKRVDSFGCTGECDVPIKLLHKVLEDVAEKNPDKEAIVACDRSYTFKELNDAANIVANNLIAKNVKKGDSVALLLPRRGYFFAAMYGVLKAGAAYIPCDPEYPADRINHIIADSGALYIITTDEHIADYPADKVLNISEVIDGTDTSTPEIDVQPDDLVYMIYTSGSTGKPKGVMLHHYGICNYVYSHPANIIFDTVNREADKIISVTTVSFDMSLKEHVGFLSNGKTVVFANEDQMNDPRALATLFEETGADAFNATPSRLMQYMSYEPFKKALSQCHVIMSGGEMYPISLRDSIKKVSNAHILNTYGPTEITVSSNGAEITNTEYVSIGKPLVNYKEYIVDADGNLLPPGVIGELYIGGAGVAKGYKNLDEMTAERFINYNGIRIYRSGDYAKWDNNGNVIVLGRRDNQVKLRGLRIELGEIEGLIAKQPNITKAVVIVRKLNGQDNLCAYFTADTAIDVDNLKTELKKHLTHYMVPTAYLQMETMPVTPNGKTDIKNLPEPIAVTSDEYVAPANDTEEYFCELFKTILGIDKVGAEDNFFEIGGTSLVVTSVVIDAEEHGYKLTYGDVFKYTTPRMLAALFTGEVVADTSILNFDKYDYSKINECLAKNNLQSFLEGEKRELGNILITGATGYMGVHILAQFLKSEKGKAYCFVRKGRFETSFKRLRSIMHYYFEGTCDKELEQRVEAINGDVTNYDDFEQLEAMDINTVFNCAANVKHFSNGTDIEDINIGGAENCVRLCEKIGARLIHFSTTSVSGSGDVDKKYSVDALSEQDLYYGQNLDTKYTSSKLMSERKVLEAVAERGLDGKVIRVGTLAPREADGEFQINYLTNNFIGRLRSYMILGCFPYSMYENVIRMGPIDTSAEAFLLLAKTPSNCCVFNAINNHTIPLGDIINDMKNNDIMIDFVEDREFGAALALAEKDPQKASILSSMLAYKNMSHGKKVIGFGAKCEYTTQVLARMGFFWNASSERYINAFIKGLIGFGFFDSDNLNR